MGNVRKTKAVDSESHQNYGRCLPLTRSGHDDPVNHLEENAVDFFQEFDDDRLILAMPMHLVEHTTETHSKDNGEDDDTCKVGGIESRNDVVGDELGEDAVVHSVTQTDIITCTPALLDKGPGDIVHDELHVVFRSELRGAHDVPVGVFGQEGAVCVTGKGDVRRAGFGEHFLLVLSLHHERGDNTQ